MSASGIDIDTLYGNQDDDFADGLINAARSTPKKVQKNSGHAKQGEVKPAQRDKEIPKKSDQ